VLCSGASTVAALLPLIPSALQLASVSAIVSIVGMLPFLALKIPSRLACFGYAG